MKPAVDGATFGSITIGLRRYEHDVVIRLDGEVKKRRKKLSKEVYGTSHILSLEEAKHVYEKGASRLVVGTGQEGMLKLSAEAEKFFTKKKCELVLLPTCQAVKVWNESGKGAIGLFHVTC